jgi:predicted Zn-ribbon and HTH transcriptional regulator
MMMENTIQEKPYFCPNCRSNRVKFSVVTLYSQPIMKDAVTGTVSDTNEPEPVAEQEPNIQCRVCGFTGNEMRFVKQAEREPRR